MQPLGVGGTGETYLCKRRDNGKEEAVKVIKRPIPSVLQNLITNEVILQASLGEGHVNIVNAHELMLTDTHLCLFMEYISGGTLTDYVSARCDTADQRLGLYLDEDEARFLFRVRPPSAAMQHPPQHLPAHPTPPGPRPLYHHNLFKLVGLHHSCRW